MKLEDFLIAFENADATSHYPADFLGEYTMMECLSERNGVDTFLVQNQTGQMFIAKCYDVEIWKQTGEKQILSELQSVHLPKQIAVFENENVLVTVREYIDGISLDRYAMENELSSDEITRICIRLCDILEILHHRKNPVIHRDIKPQNIIVKPDGEIALIDFDIARIFRSENDTDTYFFGTVAYAPPEQYGFSQTDTRTDIYSFGVLLRYLLTGSTKENKNIRVYRPLGKIIDKCTAFSPKERFSDISQVRRALVSANPRAQLLKKLKISGVILLMVCLVSFGGRKLYQYITYDPFTDTSIPGALNDKERIQDAVRYMKDKYKTELFDSSLEEHATMGFVRKALMELYGFDKEYVYACQEEGELPEEGEAYFFPWDLDDGQTVRRDTMVYTAVKVHDAKMVADWSDLKDDTGEYPGERVAVAFAEKTGILTGANRPYDITVGEVALILANTDRVFEAAKDS
ncbi:MAG: serine/threonine protein kinase [Lachnospiraceae bacterium]|nr:serine/threonine protein kinase [Lachnospiraceae bacterium]